MKAFVWVAILSAGAWVFYPPAGQTQVSSAEPSAEVKACIESNAAVVERAISFPSATSLAAKTLLDLRAKQPKDR